MSEKSHTLNVGSNRRTFLKTVGATMSVAGYGSASGVRNENDNLAEKGSKPTAWRTSWIGPRSGPQRTGTVDEIGPTPFPTTDWKMDLEGGMYNVEPIVVDETLFLSVTTNNTPGERDGYVGAYDAETGNRQWIRTDFSDLKTPAIDDGKIYLVTQHFETPDSDADGFYALDADTGETLWSRTDHDVWSPPVATDDLVFTSNRTATFALDPENGDTVWTAPGINGLSEDVGDALGYTNGTVFTSDGAALDATDGSTQWRVEPEVRTLGSPAATDDLVYYTRTDYIVGDDDRVLIEARSVDSGATEWKYESDGTNRWDGRPAVSDDHVLLVDSEDESVVKALDSETGTTVWTTWVQGSYFSSPVVADEIVYVGGQYAPEESSSDGDPVVHAIDSETGDRKWSYLLDEDNLETSPTDVPAAGVPVATGGKLYTATHPGGATLDYKYVYYSNFFVLGSCGDRPDRGRRLPTGKKPDDPSQLDACIEVEPNLDSDDLSAGDTVRFDASCSTGGSLQYEWDTDGDGQYDDTGRTSCITVPSDEALMVELRITDSNGDTDITSVLVSAH